MTYTIEQIQNMTPEQRRRVPQEDMEAFIAFTKKQNAATAAQSKPAWWQDPFTGFKPIRTREEYEAAGSPIGGRFTSTPLEQQRQNYMKNPQYQYIEAMNKTNQANEARYNEIMGLYGQATGQQADGTVQASEKAVGSIYDEIANMFREDSAYGEGAMALLERAKKQSVGAAGQRAMSGGIYNTTDVKALAKKYDEDVGSPYLANVNDMRMRMLSSALTGKAGFAERNINRAERTRNSLGGIMERREDVQPDMNLYAGLTKSAASRPMMGGYPYRYSMSMGTAPVQYLRTAPPLSLNKQVKRNRFRY